MFNCQSLNPNQVHVTFDSLCEQKATLQRFTVWVGFIDLCIKACFFLCSVSDTAVDERMEVLIGPSAASKPVGETVLLPCVVKGFPLPVVRWLRNSRIIDERCVPVCACAP